MQLQVGGLVSQTQFVWRGHKKGTATFTGSSFAWTGPINESESLTPMNKSSETLIRINEASLIAEKYAKHLT